MRSEQEIRLSLKELQSAVIEMDASRKSVPECSMYEYATALDSINSRIRALQFVLGEIEEI